MLVVKFETAHFDQFVWNHMSRRPRRFASLSSHEPVHHGGKARGAPRRRPWRRIGRRSTACFAHVLRPARRAGPSAAGAVRGDVMRGALARVPCAAPGTLCRGSNAARQPRQRRMSLQCSGAAAAPAITVQCRGALGKGGPGRGPGPGGGWAEAVGATRRAACVWPRAQRRKVLIGPTTWLGPQTARRGAAGARARARPGG